MRLDRRERFQPGLRCCRAVAWKQTITETPSIVERGDIGSALRSREKTLEYISVSALLSHLPNLGIFGEQLTRHPAIGPVFPWEGDGGALPNLESSSGGKRDMIRVRKSTDCQTETARDSRPSRALSASQGAAEGSMQHLAPVPLCPSHNERMKVNLA